MHIYVLIIYDVGKEKIVQSLRDEEEDEDEDEYGEDEDDLDLDPEKFLDI